MAQFSGSSQLFAPIAIPLAVVAIGIFFGILFALPKKRSTGAIAAAGWAVTSGAAMWAIALANYQQLANIQLFSDFSQLIRSSAYPKLMFGDFQDTAVATLIGLYEIGLILGFAAFSDRGQVIAVRQSERAIAAKPRVQVVAQTEGRSTDHIVIKSSQSIQNDDPEVLKNQLYEQPSESNVSHVLDKDERTIVELFLFGNTAKIFPRVDVSRPEGYYFEGASSLKLDTSRMRRLLDLLVRKNILKAEMEDKMLVCKECGSPNLQLRSMCPECKSMKLSKHNIVEHFSCGLIERQESFRTPSGDLVCPKCNAKLHLVGSDYRYLSHMYVCSECNALNKDLLQQMKCGECGTVSPVGEEREQYLYTYTLNERAASELGDQIKPVEVCSTYFKSRGYVVVAPAFVSGESGTQHIFDMLVLDSRKPTGAENEGVYQPQGTGSIVVEILVSQGQIDLPEITRVYGKMCDVDCQTLIFAVPDLTADARNYADRFKIRVVEGRSIEEVLRKSEFTSFATENVRQ
ncbi:MAG: hypothetical protein JRN20_10990 [Nitrososphaerota archaeon]|nr:hypothetical protein [Nitrososphaerota archaeon]